MPSSGLRDPTSRRARSLLLWLATAFGTFLLLFVTLLAGADTASRVVAIGDIHGRLERLVSVMQRAGLLDDRSAWSGGDTVFVVMGDFMDRGPDVRAVMDLLMRVQKEASRKHGEVVVLLGNHEMMNIIGDYRYVTLEIFGSFAEKDSGKHRQEAFRRYQSTLSYQRRLLGQPAAEEGADDEAEWMRRHPLGFVEYVEAMGPNKPYGKWLRTLPVMVKIDGTVFVHGGIHPGLRSFSISDLNKRIEKERDVYDNWKRFLVQRRVLEPFYTLHEALTSARAFLDFYAEGPAWDAIGQSITTSDELVRVLKTFLEMDRWLSVSPDGPLWFRGFAKWTDEEGEQWIGPLLEAFQAKRFVVGHTVLGEGITRRFDDRVFLIDTARPSALEFRGGEIQELYADSPEVYEAPSR
ncbi:MAG: metallophosphoesterase [Acidobacteriota bacterium]